MSTQNTHALPDAALLEQMISAIKVDEGAALELLRLHPGLARTDAEWYGNSDKSPLVWLAIDYDRAALLEALLNAGSNPNAPTSLANPDRHPVEYVMHRTKTEDNLRMLELLLRHPDCGYDRAKYRATERQLLITDVPFMLNLEKNPETLKRLQNVFITMLDRLPEELKQPEKGFARELFSKAYDKHELDTEQVAFMLRAMVDRGFGLNNDCIIFGQNPAQVLFESQRPTEDPQEMLGNMLATGMQDECPLWVKDGVSQTVGEYLDLIRKNFPIQDYREMPDKAYARAREILGAELEKIRSSGDARKVLFTPGGHASWQAQGLAARDMLGDALLTHNPGATAETREQLADRIEEALPPSLRNSLSMRRERSLARPSEGATVEYLRGGVEVTKGGVA